MAAATVLGPIQDCDFFIVLPDGVIKHYNQKLEFVGELDPGFGPGPDCAFGLLQFFDSLVLVENCLSPGVLTR